LEQVLGWADWLPRQNQSATGRSDVPDVLLFGDAATLERARGDHAGDRDCSACPLDLDLDLHRHANIILGLPVVDIGHPAPAQHRTAAVGRRSAARGPGRHLGRSRQYRAPTRIGQAAHAVFERVRLRGGGVG
jgi:hypothetical protein